MILQKYSKYVDLVIKKHLSLLLWMLKTVVNVSVAHSKDNDNNYLWLAFAQITSTEFVYLCLSWVSIGSIIIQTVHSCGKINSSRKFTTSLTIPNVICILTVSQNTEQNIWRKLECLLPICPAQLTISDMSSSVRPFISSSSLLIAETLSSSSWVSL